MQGMPCSSRTVRSSVTLNRSRMKRASVCLSASGVVMPSSVSRRASRPAMPQMSVSGRRASSASIAASSSITQTPAQAGSFLARWFATLASVLVAAMPTETGMPVHCSTRRRSARACASSRVLEAAEAEKGFVDRIEFELRREIGEHAHHARAHIAIERVIARAHAQDASRRCARAPCARARPWRCRAPWPHSSARSRSRRCWTGRRAARRAAPAETRARSWHRNYCSRPARGEGASATACGSSG